MKYIGLQQDLLYYVTITVAYCKILWQNLVYSLKCCWIILKNFQIYNFFESFVFVYNLFHVFFFNFLYAWNNLHCFRKTPSYFWKLWLLYETWNHENQQHCTDYSFIVMFNWKYNDFRITVITMWTDINREENIKMKNWSFLDWGFYLKLKVSFSGTNGNFCIRNKVFWYLLPICLFFWEFDYYKVTKTLVPGEQVGNELKILKYLHISCF